MDNRNLDSDEIESHTHMAPPIPSLSSPQPHLSEAASNIVGSGISGSTSAGRAAKRPRTSWIWKHVSIVEDFKNKQGVVIGPRGVCNYCGNDYSCVSHGGNGHIERHLHNKHKSEIGEGDTDSVTGLSNFVYTQPKMRHGLALYVAAAEQPFTFGDDIRFEHFMQTCLNPAFSKVSRNTTRSDCLKAFTELRMKLIGDIAQLGSTISFTSDMWSGRNNLGYITLTAHYIDCNWILTKKIIAFRLMEYPHNGNHIFQCINGIFREFQIVDKVFSITFDNHTANTSAIDLFKRNLSTPHSGQFFHMRCVCHIINLVVQDGLKHIAPQIEKIRDAILFISTSPARQQEFEGLCASFHVKPKKMKTDIKTRWNSTFLMLKSCRNHAEVITAFVNAKYADASLCQTD